MKMLGKIFKEIHPYTKKVFTKSDNAGCYHTLYSPEALYQICRIYDFELFQQKKQQISAF